MEKFRNRQGVLELTSKQGKGLKILNNVFMRGGLKKGEKE